MTPTEYLPILLRMLEDRLPRIKRNRSYVNGNAPLPEMGPNLRESWEAFQKKARTNLGGRTCESLAGRIVPLAVRVGSNSGPAAEQARMYWRDTRLGMVFADAIWNALTTSVGYVLTQVVDGRPIPTSERPEQMITLPDPLQPWKARAAIKAWRDSVTGRDRATVWADGVEQRFVRDSRTDTHAWRSLTADGWSPDGEPVEFDGNVPVHVLENEHGVSEIEPHIDLVDRINVGKLQRLSTVAMQAFRQRAIEGLPDQDEEGNDLDYSDTFEAAPGAIWDLPEGVKIHELADGSAGIQAMLSGEEADIREYCGVTGTPMSNFLSDAQNQSAEGATNAKEAEIAKAVKRTTLFRPALEGVILDALRVYGVDTGESVEVQFAPPAYISYQEKASAASLAKASGMSSRWIARHIWGMSPDEISEMEQDLAIEQLAMFGDVNGDAS